MTRQQLDETFTKLRAIRVVKEWFDQAHEPIVMSTGHLDSPVVGVY
jgi:hypothetical protein